MKSFAQVRRRPGVGNSQRAATVANELLTKSVHVADSMSSKAFILLARPEGFGPPTYGFVVIGRRVSGIARGAAKIAAPPYFMRPSARLATSGWWCPVEGFGAVLDTVWARGGHVPAGSEGVIEKGR